jgi:hypothetical protein
MSGGSDNGDVEELTGCRVVSELITNVTGI